MSGGRRYYFGAEQRYKNSADKDDDPLYPCDDNNNSNKGKANNDPEPDADAVEDADKDEFDSEFLQDVPYSSSSIDRSSVGSIPWADDAIKKNKLDWERVDRMLSGEEALPEQEVELRHEIADWQRKFPSLLARKAKPLKQQSFDNGHSHPTVPDDSAEIESLSDLSLNSLDDYDERDEDDGFLTPTVDRPQAMPSTRHYQRSTQNQRLVAMLDRDLRITSVALNLRKREHSQKPIQPAPAPTTPQSATVTRSRLRMPPILNVLDSNRRFRGLLNNRSFVQLTQVQQQPKSAALTYASSAERRQQAGIRSAWNMPMAASRFLNNKNAIVLPSLNRHRDFTTTATTSGQSISSGTGNSSSVESTRRGMGHNSIHQHSHPHQHQVQYDLTLGEISTNANNTPSTGRSISAAIHHPRSQFATSSAFYIPYSASKFKAFK
ncbi:hypothetical protein ACLKA6_014306 [Drosophila palustris]